MAGAVGWAGKSEPGRARSAPPHGTIFKGHGQQVRNARRHCALRRTRARRTCQTQRSTLINWQKHNVRTYGWTGTMTRSGQGPGQNDEYFLTGTISGR